MPDLADHLLSLISDGVKYESKLRLAINGVSGGGKSLTALVLAKHLCSKISPDAYILAADSEHQSLLKYADLVKFRHLPLPSHSLDHYLAVIDVAERLAEKQPLVLVIDTGSHAWMGRGGALETVDAYAEQHRTQRGAKNTFNAWGGVRPKLNRLEDRINDCAVHIIVTYRMKKKNIQTTDPETGRTRVESVGLEVVAQDGVEFCFDLVADLNQQKDLVIVKTRAPRLEGKVFHRLAHVEPLQLDKEAPDSTIGIIDMLWDWMKGVPYTPSHRAPEQPTAGAAAGPQNGGNKPSPNLSFIALADEFAAIGATDVFLTTLRDNGLDQHFAAHKMDDPAIETLARTIYKILLATLKLKQIQRNQTGAQAVNVSTAAPDDSPKPAAETPQSTPVATSPVQPAAPVAACAPANGTIQETVNRIAVGDFSNDEIAWMFSVIKKARPRGYNRIALAREITSFEGTREDWIAGVKGLQEIAAKQEVENGR